MYYVQLLTMLASHPLCHDLCESVGARTAAAQLLLRAVRTVGSGEGFREHRLTLGSRSVARFHGDLVSSGDGRRATASASILLRLLALSLALEVLLKDSLLASLLVLLALL